MTLICSNAAGVAVQLSEIGPGDARQAMGGEKALRPEGGIDLLRLQPVDMAGGKAERDIGGCRQDGPDQRRRANAGKHGQRGDDDDQKRNGRRAGDNGMGVHLQKVGGEVDRAALFGQPVAGALHGARHIGHAALLPALDDILVKIC